MDGLVFITKEPKVLREINTRTTIEATNLTILIILISNIWFILPIPKPHWWINCSFRSVTHFSGSDYDYQGNKLFFHFQIWLTAGPSLLTGKWNHFSICLGVITLLHKRWHRYGQYLVRYKCDKSNPYKITYNFCSTLPMRCIWIFADITFRQLCSARFGLLVHSFEHTAVSLCLTESGGIFKKSWPICNTEEKHTF